MLSLSDRVPRVCIFGDSHHATWRVALKEGLVRTDEMEIEFWGHTGQRFRYLMWEEGRIRAADDYTARRFAMMNEKGRLELDPADFDAVVFAGCRLTTGRLFAQLLHARRQHDAFITSALASEIIRNHLYYEQTYQFARRMAARGDTQVIFAPVSFDTVGMAQSAQPLFPGALEAGPADRGVVWELMEAQMTKDGIALIRQPEETVAGGVFTRNDFACAGYAEREDHTHKNAAYGALVFNLALERVRQVCPA